MTRTVDICHHKDQRAHYWAGQGGGYKANLASTTPLQHTGKNKLKCLILLDPELTLLVISW